MKDLRITFPGLNIGAQIKAEMDTHRRRISANIYNAGKETAETIERKGRLDIARAGNFGARWIDGFKAHIEKSTVIGESGRSRYLTITVTEEVPYWQVFETGATIYGRPLLWIPLSWTKLSIRARDYPGDLFRVDRKKGAPLLLDSKTKEPKYFGIEQVTLKKRFHIRDILSDETRKFRERYIDQMRLR